MQRITAPAMREQMALTVMDLLERDPRLVTVLGDISVDLFKAARRRYPERVFSVGIMEQTMVSFAAGLALEGLIPVVHSIAPFVVERPFEQIKDDFCYQRLGGNFISIGASYDYSAEGMTHHGPGDVHALLGLPGMRVIVPGASAEFDTLFREAYVDDAPTYYRLSVQVNAVAQPVSFGQAVTLRQGSPGTAVVVAVGPALEPTLAAIADLDVTALYYTTIAPFDAAPLRAACAGSPVATVAVIEPFYAGTLTASIVNALAPQPVRVEAIGVPHMPFTHYGTVAQHHEAISFTPAGIRRRVQALVDAGLPLS